jgi:hypothetical protein
VWCLRQVIVQKGHACHDCGAVSFIARGARWSAAGAPTLDIALTCAMCSAGSTVPLSREEARRCGFEDPY